MPAKPAPFCQVDIGDISITYVPDGQIFGSPTGSYPGSTEEMWSNNADLLDEEGRLVMSVGSLLVRSAGRTVLVDLGWGPTSVPIGGSGGISGGALVENLAKLGVEPRDVDAVVFSHLHSDHTGWIVDPSSLGDGGGAPRAMFENADHYLSQAEWDFWSGERPERGPAPTADQLAVLESRLAMTADGDRPVPGIDIMATPGHTPGHLSFVISSGNERAIVLGDAVHCPIEILEPELTFVVDVDPALAKRTRAHIAKELSEPGTITAGAHFADLVFGRLMKGEGRSSFSFASSQVLPVAS